MCGCVHVRDIFASSFTESIPPFLKQLSSLPHTVSLVNGRTALSTHNPFTPNWRLVPHQTEHILQQNLCTRMVTGRAYTSISSNKDLRYAQHHFPTMSLGFQYNTATLRLKRSYCAPVRARAPSRATPPAPVRIAERAG